MPSMPSVLKPFTLALLLAAGGLAVPAEAAVAVLPLEPPRTLPDPVFDTGHTPPNVALRSDGGYVAVWADLTAGQVIGRSFGPPAREGSTEGAVFALSAEDATFSGPVAMARGAEDAYLAVWKGPGTGATDLVARAFDGSGEPLGDARPVVTGAVMRFPFDLAPRPGGGYVLAWAEETDEGWDVRYRFLGPDGTPFGSFLVAEVPAGARGARVRVATDAGGAFTITWSWWRTDDDAGALEARGFGSSGQPLGPPYELVPQTTPRFEIQHDVVAVAAGEYLLAWTADSTLDDPTGTLRVRRFSGDGATVGLDRRIDGGAEDLRVAHPVLAAGPKGDVVAAWAEGTVFFADRPVARLLDAAGEPRGEPFGLLADALEGDFVNGLGADRDAQGRLVFGWGIGIDPGVIPTGEHGFWTSQARRFQETEAGCHPILTLTFATEPADPDEDDAVDLEIGGLADCAVVSLTGWSLEGDTFQVVAEAESQACGTFPPFPIALDVPVGALAAGDYGVDLEIALPGGGTCERSYGFTVDTGDPVEPPPPPPPPAHPDAPPLTSDALPGYRVWVEITDQAGDAILGTAVGPCIPETLCVAGRLPDRHEVFVRVVGPKPNGRLWPTLVKFTTSQVEVWIEQAATGEVEYYLLEGARPGFDRLPGLFDREGFEP